jgi:hypothetical protein
MLKQNEVPWATAVGTVAEGGGGGAEEAQVALAPSIQPRGETATSCIRELEKMDLPPGLVDIIAKSSEDCAVRYWIVSFFACEYRFPLFISPSLLSGGQ